MKKMYKVIKTKSHKDIQDELAEKLTKQGKEFFRCPVCEEVYKGCCGLVSCCNCGYVDKKYKKKGRTIVKIKK